MLFGEDGGCKQCVCVYVVVVGVKGALNLVNRRRGR